MILIFNQFTTNVEEVRKTHLISTSISLPPSSVVNIDNIRRSCIVLIVSAIDHLTHELVIAGMLDIYTGNRPPTNRYDSHSVSLGFVRLLHSTTPPWGFENEIRKNLGWQTFQRPDKIKEAISLISPIQLWQQVSVKTGISEINIKKQLNLLVDRRNMIAHEADIEPIFKTKRPINDTDISESIDFIEKIGTAIYELVK